MADKQKDEHEAGLRNAIAAAFVAISEALDAYTTLHAALAKDRPAITHGGKRLDAAVWELMGHCLSLANALVFLLRHGYIVQSDVILRAVWETNSVLATIVAPEECDLRERWLEGQNIPYSATVRAMERLERRFKEESSSFPPGEAMRTSWENVYRLLSAGTHARRSAVSRSNLPSGFAYTNESSQVDEAVTVLLSTGLLFLVTLSFERALSFALGPNWSSDAVTKQRSKGLLRAVGVIASEMRTVDHGSDAEGPNGETHLSDRAK